MTKGVAFRDVLTHGCKFRCFCFKDQVSLVVSKHLSVGWNWHDGQVIGSCELTRLCFSSSCHSGEFFVESEIVLQRHRCPRVVFLTDPHAFFRLNGLMEAVRPSTTVKRPTRELIDDLDLTVGHEVILVTPIKFFGSQRLRELVNVIDRYRVIEVGNTERLLDFFDSRLSRHD